MRFQFQLGNTFVYVLIILGKIQKYPHSQYQVFETSCANENEERLGGKMEDYVIFILYFSLSKILNILQTNENEIIPNSI